MYTVFLVDDEPIVLRNLQSMSVFSECGFQICGVATDPFAAVEQICAQKPDVVFSDLKMPGLSGTNLLLRVKKKGIPCEAVLISAYGEFTAARDFFTAGGFDYLVKPVSENELSELLNTLADKLRKKNTEEQKTPKSPSPELNLVLKHIEENLSAKQTLEAIGLQFSLNPTYICNLFSKHLNTTFSSYVTALRMEEAGRLLRETTLSVKELAPLCGYTDYFYFCRVFREYYHCTPSGYREGRL